MNSAATIPALDNTYGCIVLGAALTMALWGAGTLQLYSYYDRYWKSDKTWMKLNVFAIWAMDTVHQAFIVQVTYTNLVTDFSNILSLGNLNTTILTVIILTTFNSALVQVLFIMRIWHLSKRNCILTCLVTVLVVGATVPSIIYFAKARHFTNAVQLESLLSLERAATVTSAFTDVTLTVILVYLLQSNRTSSRRTDTLIKRLIIYTINTGLVPGLFATLSMISGFLFPESYIYIMFYFMVSPLYMNSILASLNSRRKLLAGLSDNSYQGLSIVLAENISDTRLAHISANTLDISFSTRTSSRSNPILSSDAIVIDAR